jgi:hypothetical protein
MKSMILAACLVVAGLAFAGCGDKVAAPAPAPDAALHAPLPGIDPCVPCRGNGGTEPGTTAPVTKPN